VDCTHSPLKEAAHDISGADMTRNLRALLVTRLERQGVDQAQMAGFLREMEQLLRELPDVTLPSVNARLHYLGWGDVTLDYRSMQFAAFCMDDRRGPPQARTCDERV
jgi:hypothetical protein